MSQVLQYEVWSPSAPDKVYAVGEFIDCEYYTNKR